MKNLGQIAFEAYCEYTGGKTHDGKDVPPWSDLGDQIQGAWEASACAVVTDGTWESFPAGTSDKYGRVYTERLGNTGFDDKDEPVALFRAQDRHSVSVLSLYLSCLMGDKDAPHEHIEGVRRQLARFLNWRDVNPTKVRTPGTPA